MHILITGGTGFIGSHLCHYFLQQGHVLSVLTRHPMAPSTLPLAVKKVDSLDKAVQYDVIINLAGAPLNKHRWSKHTKAILYDSRIQTTQKVVNYIHAALVKPTLLISGSAIGFYGNSQNTVFTENSPSADTGFTHQLCDDWEKVALIASPTTRVCTIRTGVVLGKEGGILAAMLPTYQLGVGAKFGQGTQWMSWIHIQDVVRIIDYLITHTSLEGSFNLTAPHPVTHHTFTHCLAKTLHRPCLFKFPSFLVKLIFGDMGEVLLLQGQNVMPENLIQAGYSFLFPTLEQAFNDLFQST